MSGNGFTRRNGNTMIPRFLNDSDEENSVHLHHVIGKAQPLRSSPKYRNTTTTLPNKSTRINNTSGTHYSNRFDIPSRQYDIDQEISDALYRDNIGGETIAPIDEQELNESYKMFLNGEIDSDYIEDEDDDYNLEAEDYDLTDEDTYNEELSEYNSPSEDDEIAHEVNGLEDIRTYQKKSGSLNKATHSFETTKLNRFNKARAPKENEIYEEKPERELQNQGKLNIDEDESSRHLPQQKNGRIKKWLIYILIGSISFLLTLYLLIFARDVYPRQDSKYTDTALNERLNQLTTLIESYHYSTLEKFDKLDSQLSYLEEKTRLNSDQAVALSNGQVQVSPEFHQFLTNFVDSYRSSSSSSISNGGSGNGSSSSNNNDDSDEKDKYLLLDKRLRKLESLSDFQSLKQHVNMAIEDVANTIKVDVQSSIDEIFDGITIINDTLVPQHATTSQIWVNSMVDLISKCSKHKNYAEFTNGARILGFLTSKSELEKRWFFQALLPGGASHDFLTDPHNANHVILDDDIIWAGGDELGIRLSSSIIPTDILIECGDIPQETQVSIGFKPDSKAGFDKLRFETMASSSNKYASKYKLLKTNKLYASSINHIKLPVRFINSQVTGRSLYFKFDKHVNILSIKVYGITDLDATNFKSRLEMLVDKFHEDETVSAVQPQQEPQQKQIQHQNQRSNKLDGNEMRDKVLLEEVYDINEDLYL